MLMIFREEVRPGKTAAHAANEAAWAAAFAKSQAPTGWLAMTTVAGPTEAWFVTAYDSWAAVQKEQDAMDANEAATADEAKFQALDGELLNRTSRIMAAYRPAISYQAGVKLPEMRYMSIDVVRVKPGRGREFFESWRAMVEAHKTAKMDEHWAVYQVVAGQPDGTYLFMYPMKSLAEIDKAGPMHGDAAFRDAVGEAGRIRTNEMTVSAVESSQRLVFALSPKMSLLDKAWSDAGPVLGEARRPPRSPRRRRSSPGAHVGDVAQAIRPALDADEQGQRALFTPCHPKWLPRPLALRPRARPTSPPRRRARR